MHFCDFVTKKIDNYSFWHKLFLTYRNFYTYITKCFFLCIERHKARYSLMKIKGATGMCNHFCSSFCAGIFGWRMIQQKYLFVLFENRLKEKVKHKNRTAALQAEK